jgi:AraC family transcriptional regulator
MKPTAGMPRGRLAPWQGRRAKELMSDSLQEEIPLSLLANECGLSVRHFARAFRVSTGLPNGLPHGLPPHRWLLRYRVHHAMELLRTSVLALMNVALFCGFADQSHFTRLFTAILGVSAGTWRRTNSIQSIDGE